MNILIHYTVEYHTNDGSQQCITCNGYGFGGYGYGVGKTYPQYTRTKPYLPCISGHKLDIRPAANLAESLLCGFQISP
jgi:hypothetical protein